MLASFNMAFYRARFKLHSIKLGILTFILFSTPAVAMTRTKLKEGVYSAVGRSFPPSLDSVRQLREIDPKLIELFESRNLEQGLRLEQFSLTEDSRQTFGSITLVRIETRLFSLSLLSSPGDWHSPSQWLDQNGFSATINAGMHQTDGDSAGLLISNAIACNENTQDFSGKGFLGLNPIDPTLPSAVIFNQNDSDFDLSSMKLKYKDAEGQLVLIYSNLFVDVSTLNIILALPVFSLRSAVYTMGGPRAALCVRNEDGKIMEYGDFQFLRNVPLAYWWTKIPNTVGVKRKELVSEKNR
jgi:hypothetical protein